MNRTTIFRACVLVVLVAGCGVVPLLGATPRFGKEPLADVLNAAQQNNQCSASLTTNQLAAMVLTVTWPEVTGNVTTLTPSPMAVGRADTASALYYQGATTGAHRRAFWHPGDGAWQLDDKGLGTRLAEGKFNTANSSATAAAEISKRYCSTKTLDYALAPWLACKRTANICQQIYDTLFSPPNTLRTPDTDSSTARFGGVQSRTCIRTDSAGPFPCYYVNFANAQGYTANWTVSANGTPPLSWSFYIYSETVGSMSYEWRHWMATDSTAASPINIAARRTYGADSRSGLKWSSTTPLCDITGQRGPCTSLTARTAGAGTGTIRSTPAGINCGSTCTATYATGSSVTLVALPASGSTVSSWSGCDTSSGNSCTVTMSGNRTVTATFTASYTLQVSKSGTGSGTITSDSGGINCGSTCSGNYGRGVSVKLTASAASGSNLTSWSGCDSTSGSTCTVAMNSNRTVTATFTATPPPPRERLVNGSFSSGSSGWNLGGDFWSGTNLSNYRSKPGYAAGGVDSSGSPKNNASGYMYQSFTVPAKATTAKLTFWINVTSEDTSSVSSDKMNVTLQDTSGKSLTSICSITNLNRRSDPRDYYWSCSLNLLPWAGRTVRVNFSATTNASLRTTFRIDDVSVMADGN